MGITLWVTGLLALLFGTLAWLRARRDAHAQASDVLGSLLLMGAISLGLAWLLLMTARVLHGRWDYHHARVRATAPHPAKAAG